MNSLSWLLYLSDLAANVDVLLKLLAVACAITTAAVLITGAIMRHDAEFDSDPVAALAHGKAFHAKAPLFVALAIVLAAASAVLPSRNTIMLIAASEVGASILTSEKAAEIGGEAGALATDSLKLLRKYITEQLGEKTPPSAH